MAGGDRHGGADERDVAAEPLFAWIHLSDLQLGHGGTTSAADQQLVLAALRDDIAAVLQRERLQPDAVLVTGDIAWSGATDQYAAARMWLGDVARAAGLEERCIYVVPGNHDVDPDGVDRHAARLVVLLRDGSL